MHTVVGCVCYRSKKGHILGRHTSRPGAAPERELSSLSCAVLRCLTHLSMMTAALFERRKVNVQCEGANDIWAVLLSWLIME